MKKLIIFTAIVFSIISLSNPKKIFAKQQAFVERSAAISMENSSYGNILAQTSNATYDNYHTQILHAYLLQENSPLAAYASEFVSQARQYNLDWKLVAAISGVESTFGQQIPTGSYNACGWGIYGTKSIYFNSWQQGIDTISSGLRQQYMNKWGAGDVFSIGRIYSSSSAWPYHVEYFMNQIQSFADSHPAYSLSLLD